MTNLYKPNILVIGPSGSGKSTSWRNCDPEDTFIIDTELKGFPFKADKFKHVRTASNIGEFNTAVAEAEKSPCSVCIIDSISGFLELNRALAKASKTGWDIWNMYNDNFEKQVVKKMQSKDKIWVGIGHEEVIKTINSEGEERSSLRFSIQGKTWEGKVEYKYLLVLFSTARKNNGTIKYQFITNSDGIATAKSPAPLELPLYVDNDLSKIIQQVKEKL